MSRSRSGCGALLRAALPLWLAALTITGRAHAQTGGGDQFRQTVVVTAASVPVTFETATRTISLVTREQLQTLPVRTVADALRMLTSVDVRARGARGTQTDFAVRGAGFGQMLVLVDGVRLNDAQSGHHNGDIPVPLDAVERIEILHGAGSSVFGADAFGGTVNIITRRDAAPPAFGIEAGSFDTVSLRAQASPGTGRLRQQIAASFDRSSGFTDDRDFENAVLSVSTAIGQRSRVSARLLRKAFGAANFYGNAPSREWTNQALFDGEHRFAAPAGWTLVAQGSYRTHGDRFIFDRRRVPVSASEHRTHAAWGSLKASTVLRPGTTVTIGAEAGGDVIRSNNLGDHSLARGSAFGEWRQAFGSRTHLEASLRMDRYAQFGSAWNPGVGASWWASPSARLRTSVGRAFRVPTFTERFYSDPAHLARSEVGPETSWSGDAGLDLFPADGWTVQGTVFARADADVIDWLRDTPADRWRTYNVHDVDTVGVELSVRRDVADAGWVTVGYTGLDVRAAQVTSLSKYVLDYAPHILSLGGMARLPGALIVAPRLQLVRRTRPTGDSDYVLMDARVSRRFGRLALVVDGTNLLSADYQEVAGVAMPGRAVTASLDVGLR
ncbi:MAG: TonB-dependent receptor [Acidobacteria bacterium]|nr:TonB-dependent receptor [Acidobacteriota bacterium]